MKKHCIILAALVFAYPFSLMATLGDVPVSNFQMTLFNANGAKAWILKGKEGLCMNGQEEIDIKDMRLETFSENGQDLEATILSPSAHILTASKIAFGQDFVTVVTPSYTMLGKGWHYDGPTQRIVIKENVRVTFLNTFLSQSL